MFKLRKIKAPIEVLKPPAMDKLPLGHQYINHAYPNVLLLAKKNSGKTNVIYNILKQCANCHTEVVIFCPTVDLDDTYAQIIDYLDSRGIPHQQFKNIDNLKDLMMSYDKDFEVLDETENEEIEPEYAMAAVMEYKEPVKEKRARKSKFIVPEHIFIFDDCKKMLRNNVFNELLSTNRHYKAKVIISTQYFSDIHKDSRVNLDVLCVFPKIPLDTIKTLHENMQLSIPLDKFERLYLKATHQPYNFLYIDIRREKFKLNFDGELDLCQ